MSSGVELASVAPIRPLAWESPYAMGVARHSLDPMLLWLWCWLAAVALIRPLAWEPPYAMGVAKEMAKDKKIKVITSQGQVSYIFLLFKL